MEANEVIIMMKTVVTAVILERFGSELFRKDIDEVVGVTDEVIKEKWKKR
jgi:hypothetical protein